MKDERRNLKSERRNLKDEILNLQKFAEILMTKDERRNYDGGYYLYPKTKDERRKIDNNSNIQPGLRPSQPVLMPDTIQILSFVFRPSSVLCSILRRDIFRLSAKKHDEN